MKVLISWSGDASKHIAFALHNWLPFFLPTVMPWMSEKDIAKGKSWRRELTEEIKNVSIGIVCLTPENIDSPWLHFEAGAIAKAIEGTHVCTYLYKLTPTDIRGPFSEFQHTMVNERDTKNLITSLNNASPEPLTENKLNVIFEKFWPELEKALSEIPVQHDMREQRTDSDKIDEILMYVRSMSEPKTVKGHLGIDFTETFGTGITHYQEYLNRYLADYLRKEHADLLREGMRDAINSLVKIQSKHGSES